MFNLCDGQNVSLFITDMLGRRVLNVLENQNQTQGTHSYLVNTSSLSSGSYIYTLIYDGLAVSKRMEIIK